MIEIVRHRRRTLVLDLEERADRVEVTPGFERADLVAIRQLRGRIVAGSVEEDRLVVRTKRLRATFLIDGEGEIRSNGVYTWNPHEP